jgi:hypothetical protein
VLLVEPLGGPERAAGGEAEARVGLALQRREVVEERRALLLRRLLELGDLARLAADRLDDRLGLRGRLQPRLRAGVEAAGVAPAGLAAGRLERRVDQPVLLRLERPDLLLAPGEQGERRRLHAAERDRAVERGPQPDRGGARRVHADDPVGLRARPGRLLQPREVRTRTQVAERVPDRRRGHRGEPEALHGLVRVRLLEGPGEDQLALAPGVARVHDALDVVALEQVGDDAHLLLGALVAHDEPELVGDDREVRHPPFLELRVVLVGLGELHEVADRPRHDVLVGLEVPLVLLERAGEDACEIAPYGRLLGDDERLTHGRRRVAVWVSPAGRACSFLAARLHEIGFACQASVLVPRRSPSATLLIRHITR